MNNTLFKAELKSNGNTYYGSNKVVKTPEAWFKQQYQRYADDLKNDRHISDNNKVFLDNPNKDDWNLEVVGKDLQDFEVKKLQSELISKADLEMVSGADQLLDILSKGGSSIELLISHELGDLSLSISNRDCYSGAYYEVTGEVTPGVNIDMEIWLCDVTKFIFGYFPKKLFITICH